MDFTGLCSVSIHYLNPVKCDRGSVICALWFLNQTISGNITDKHWMGNGRVKMGNGQNRQSGFKPEKNLRCQSSVIR